MVNFSIKKERIDVWSQSIWVKDKIQNLTVLYIKYILGIKIRKSKMDLDMMALTIGCIVIYLLITMLLSNSFL